MMNQELYKKMFMCLNTSELDEFFTAFQIIVGRKRHLMIARAMHLINFEEMDDTMLSKLRQIFKNAEKRDEKMYKNEPEYAPLTKRMEAVVVPQKFCSNVSVTKGISVTNENDNVPHSTPTFRRLKKRNKNSPVPKMQVTCSLGLSSQQCSTDFSKPDNDVSTRNSRRIAAVNSRNLHPSGTDHDYTLNSSCIPSSIKVVRNAISTKQKVCQRNTSQPNSIPKKTPIAPVANGTPIDKKACTKIQKIQFLVTNENVLQDSVVSPSKMIVNKTVKLDETKMVSTFRTLQNEKALVNPVMSEPSGTVLKHQPFYTKLFTLMKPKVIKQGDTKEHSFKLTSQHVFRIECSRDSSANSRSRVQVHLCLIIPKCEEEQFPSFTIKVNGCPPNFKPLPGLNCNLKDELQEVDITELCNVSDDAETFITISSSQKQEFTMSVYLAAELNFSNVLARLVSRGITYNGNTLVMIRRAIFALNNNNNRKGPRKRNAGIPSLDISLLCPIGNDKMRIPCRPKNCLHFNCFDAIWYIVLNMEAPRWVCPICKGPGEFEDLIIDGLFSDVTSKLGTSCTKVRIACDGSWMPVLEQDHLAPTFGNRIVPFYHEPIKKPKMTICHQTTRIQSVKRKQKQKYTEVVDLITLD